MYEDGESGGESMGWWMMSGGECMGWWVTSGGECMGVVTSAGECMGVASDVRWMYGVVSNLPKTKEINLFHYMVTRSLFMAQLWKCPAFIKFGLKLTVKSVNYKSVKWSQNFSLK